MQAHPASVNDTREVKVEEGKTNRIRTIGVAGVGPGTGKDTAAKLIFDYLISVQIDPVHSKFATPIREDIEKLTGITVSMSETTEGKSIVLPEFDGITVGRLLQRHGLTMRILFGELYWIRQLFSRFGGDEFVLLSDVRFPNEQRVIKERGGVVIKINSKRPIDTLSLAGRDPNDTSETSLDPDQIDYVIENDGTIEQLKQRVDELMKKLIPFSE